MQYAHGRRYYIQRSTDGGTTWNDALFETADGINLWRSGRFASAKTQVESWRDAETPEDNVEYRIVRRVFQEEIVWPVIAVQDSDDPMDGPNDDDDDKQVDTSVPQY